MPLIMNLDVRALKWKMHAGLFLLFCGWGLFFEWFFGFFWSTVGSSPWIYPNSPLRYTSWEVTPIWGFGGLTIIQLSKAVRERDKRALVYVGILQILSILWIAILSTAV
jgi:hypothetical protein